MHGLADVDSGTITITALENQDMVQINIEDNGIGMTEDELLQAFDKFFTTKASKGGLGIVRDLARERLQGDHCLQSKIDRGTTAILLMKKNIENDANE